MQAGSVHGNTLEKIALALAGRVGSRLASTLGVSVGRSTLLWLGPSVAGSATTTVEVLGVDDLALRRRHRYDAILIDMETHRPADVIADRKSETVTKWLTKHLGTQLICRDRAGGYAEAARTGRPQVIEVAEPIAPMAQPRWSRGENRCSPLPLPEGGARAGT